MRALELGFETMLVCTSQISAYATQFVTTPACQMERGYAKIYTQHLTETASG